MGATGKSWKIKTTARHSNHEIKKEFLMFLIVKYCRYLFSVFQLSTLATPIYVQKEPGKWAKASERRHKNHLQCIASRKPKSCPGSKRTAEMESLRIQWIRWIRCHIHVWQKVCGSPTLKCKPACLKKKRRLSQIHRNCNVLEVPVVVKRLCSVWAAFTPKPSNLLVDKNSQ